MQGVGENEWEGELLLESRSRSWRSWGTNRGSKILRLLGEGGRR